MLAIPGVARCQVRFGIPHTVRFVEAIHQEHRVRLLLQFHPLAVLLLQIVIIVILPQRFAPVSRPQLGHEVGHARTVRDQVTGVKIHHNMFRRLINPAAIQQFVFEPVRADEFLQHIAGVLADPNDLGMNEAPRLIPQHRLSLFAEGKHCTENRVMGENRFQRFFEFSRVHSLSRELHADRIARPRLLRRVQDRVIEISLIGRQVLLSYELRLCQNIEILKVLLRKPLGDLSRRLIGVNILVVHLQRLQLSRSQRRGEGITAQFKEVVRRADSLHREHLLKGLADCLLLRRLRGDILSDYGARIRFRKRESVDLPVLIERHFLHLDEKGGNHVVRKHPLEHLPDVLRLIPEVAFFRALFQCEVAAEVDLLPFVCKILDRRVADPRDPAHAGLDLPRLHAVAVDLHHGVHAAGHHDIAVRQPLSHISGVENAVPHHLLRFLRHIDIAPEERVVEADLPCLAVRNFLSVFTQEPDLYILKDRLPNGRDIIAPVDDKLRHMKARFAHAVIVDQLNIVKIYPVRRFTSRHQCLQASGNSVRHHSEN